MMKLDLENMLYILIYMTFFLSIIGCLAYFCRRRISHETEFILIKNLFLNRFKHSEKLDLWVIIVVITLMVKLVPMPLSLKQKFAMRKQ